MNKQERVEFASAMVDFAQHLLVFLLTTKFIDETEKRTIKLYLLRLASRQIKVRAENLYALAGKLDTLYQRTAVR